jgi:hypothetical protein
MKQFVILIFIILLLAFLNISCRDSIVEVPRLTKVIEEPGDDPDSTKIFIVDGTDKKWDITHAVKHYGFLPEKFDFGLGPNAIKPIQNPVFVCEGENGYPPDNSELIVIGTSINGETRAYSLIDMRAHEIVNDQFGDAHVAVGY